MLSQLSIATSRLGVLSSAFFFSVSSFFSHSIILSCLIFDEKNVSDSIIRFRNREKFKLLDKGKVRDRQKNGWERSKMVSGGNRTPYMLRDQRRSEGKAFWDVGEPEAVGLVEGNQ